MPRQRTNPQEASFFEHLDELRVRLLRCVIYVACGMTAAWFYRSQLLAILEHPARLAALHAGLGDLPFRIFEPAGGFILMMLIAFVAGLLVSSPLWFMEWWLFLEPALEKHERRWVVFMLPLAVSLFLGGAVFCYFIADRAFEFFFAINRSMGVQVELTLAPYLRFMLYLMVGFGLSFELPMVMMFLGWIGVVDSRRLLKWWRHAVVIIFIFAAVITPTVDPFTMTFLAVPLVGLYFLSIALVRMVENRRRPTAEGLEEPGSAP